MNKLINGALAAVTALATAITSVGIQPAAAAGARPPAIKDPRPTTNVLTDVSARRRYYGGHYYRGRYYGGRYYRGAPVGAFLALAGTAAFIAAANRPRYYGYGYPYGYGYGYPYGWSGYRYPAYYPAYYRPYPFGGWGGWGYRRWWW